MDRLKKPVLAAVAGGSLLSAGGVGGYTLGLVGGEEPTPVKFVYTDTNTDTRTVLSIDKEP